MRIPPRAVLALAAVAALVVVVSGVAYALLIRDTTWESNAQLILEPQTVSLSERTAVIDAFDRSGTIGTYVELLSSRDILEEAGNPNVAVEARAIPDTRVIEVTATDGRNGVTDGLDSVLERARDAELGDLWKLTVLERPSAAERSGATTATLLIATALLACLAAIAVPLLVRGLAKQLGASVVPTEVPPQTAAHGTPTDGRGKAARERERPAAPLW